MTERASTTVERAARGGHPLRALVLAGGLTFEREVSLSSGGQVVEALHRAQVEAELHDADAELLPGLAAHPADPGNGQLQHVADPVPALQPASVERQVGDHRFGAVAIGIMDFTDQFDLVAQSPLRPILPLAHATVPRTRAAITAPAA